MLAAALCFLLGIHLAISTGETVRERRGNYDRFPTLGQAYFLDLGLNNGVSAATFINHIGMAMNRTMSGASTGNRAQSGQNAMPEFFENLTRVSHQWNIIGFEMEMGHMPSINRIKQSLMSNEMSKDIVKSFKVYPYAVSDKDGFTNFTLDHVDPNVNHGLAGASLSGESRSAIGKTVTVRTIDFANYLRTHFRREDFVFVKMDIEGAEYDVTRRLLDTGVLKRLVSGVCVCVWEWSFPFIQTLFSYAAKACLLPTYTHTLIHSYTHTLIHSYTYTLIHLHIYTLIHSYIHTLIHLCTHTLMHLYTHTLIH